MNRHSKILDNSKATMDMDLTRFSLEELIDAFAGTRVPLPPRRGLSDKMYRLHLLRKIRDRQEKTLPTVSKIPCIKSRDYERRITPAFPINP